MDSMGPQVPHVELAPESNAESWKGLSRSVTRSGLHFGKI